ncbi:uncharacterized protein LOC117651841 [Thrips palmi]|uniref:Uncharacterized protein LOC117651841 n=1 Tax=Thrips palmi TaxID=161013 RepID=A0A6P9A2U1_THRPL|nr:uncharacterized protein LOC117651841 [Thrips palmi]XP_034252147.1 uncharacterized protein LOC117651841 [Thrips palmi]XP_034252148.1 uncharacterized protein LOC117651841 [Thrips palmi]XP_034252149.1 uncharacterized protein LOC117651841 [Thrips palmi]XP_034252150.1 uncharacterized protein LOC117651841 [Thrips palmi]XP_034252151.1 uncharacterized protein LOC117651841 [Thrips palmi]XP_034252152.1 uncharacterized protein LOC117651841 [Thrips palmi]XP_034252153.1 uncharacterized protein LOC1176
MEQAYSEFITFLRGFVHRVVLVAHNGSNFDFPLLVRDMEQLGLLAPLRAVVAGTVDSIPVFRSKLPHWGQYEFGLANLANNLNVSGHGAHDALRDAEILESLCVKLHVTINDLWCHLHTL